MPIYKKKVDVTTHEGFLGGLEKNKTNGRKIIYYANTLVEMIFHDVTIMPTDPGDPKQLKKVLFLILLLILYKPT